MWTTLTGAPPAMVYFHIIKFSVFTRCVACYSIPISLVEVGYISDLLGSGLLSKETYYVYRRANDIVGSVECLVAA